MEVLRSVAELERIRSFWQRSANHRDVDLDFYLSTLAGLPDAKRPHVLVVKENGLPRAALVGRFEVRPLEIRLGYLRQRTSTLNTITFIYEGILGPVTPSIAGQMVSSIDSSLAAGEAELATFQFVSIGSPLWNALRSTSWYRGNCVVQPQRHRARRLDRHVSGFLASLSQNERWQHRKRMRKLSSDFKSLAIESFSEIAHVESLMQAAEAIAQKSYQRQLRVGFVANPLMRTRLQFLAERGWLQGKVLFLDGRPSAFWISSLYRRALYSDYLAFDPSDSAYAPGLFLIVATIESLADDPARPADRVDFGIGDATYKARLSDEVWEETNLYLFAPRLKGVALSLLQTATFSIDRMGRAALARAKLTQRLRRVWRHSH